MPDPTPQDLVGHASTVARSAAGRIREASATARSYSTKSSPTDVVTQTDLAVEEHIRSELEALVPGSSFIGEEFADVHGSNGVGWVIDPLDGTVNFLYGLPIVSVSVAATTNGSIVAGVVVDVFGDEVFSASIHGGATLDGRPITVNGTSELGQSLLATGFSYDSATRASQAERLATLMGRVSNLRCLGSAALHLCAVATGRVDGYFETDLKQWDYAAGALVAREAGAVVDLPSPENGDMLVATAPGIYEALSGLIRPVD